MPAYADLLTTAVTLVARLSDPTPEPEDVKAGWTAFALFGLLILAIVVLGFSLVKRLRNVERAGPRASTTRRRRSLGPSSRPRPDQPALISRP